MDMQINDFSGLKILPLVTDETPVAAPSAPVEPQASLVAPAEPQAPLIAPAEPQASPGVSSANAVLDTSHTNNALASSSLAFAEESPVVPAASSEAGALAPVATDVAAAPIVASKAKVVIRALRAMEDNIKNLIRLLEEDAPAEALAAAAAGVGKEYLMPVSSHESVEGRVVEGVFDGVRMVGSDGNAYPVPPNYASKSKLVEGDMLKLTIGPRGNFIFKQTGPIERSHTVGQLGFDQTIGEYYVVADDKRWNVLKASVTYFKGEPGDDAVVLVPKDAPAKWAAVENIIKKNLLA